MSPTTAEPSAEAEKTTRAYEVMMILHPELLENKTKKKLEDFEGFIQKAGGKITHKDFWGKRPLAYRIKKFKEGLYMVYDLELPTALVKEVNDHLRIDSEIVRHLIVNLPEGYTYTRYDETKDEEEESRDMRPRKMAARKSSFESRPPAPKKEETMGAEPKGEVDEAALEKKLGEIIEGENFKL